MGSHRTGHRRPRRGCRGTDGRLSEVGTYEPLRSVFGRGGGDPTLTARAWSLMSDLVR